MGEPPCPDEAELIAFLRDPRHWGDTGPVEMVETHGARVFLSAHEALKIKRPVRYDYLDFSTLDRREAMLRRELALNQRAAPEIYRDVVAITREPDGRLALAGHGPPVEWALRMVRFPADRELSKIADARGIDGWLAEALGRAVAAYHAGAEIRAEVDGPALIAEILAELDRVFGELTPPLGAAETAAFRSKAAAALAARAPQLALRAANGRVRRAHGDLHLGNMVLIGARPVPYDALEFDETLGTCDVLYDLAFLIMDLLHRGLAPAANRVLGAYLAEAEGERPQGLATLPLFLAVRAAIRAMVDVQTARVVPERAEALVADGRRFLADALQFLAPLPPQLVAIGGLSGTGKTSLGRALAPAIGAAPGAWHLRSDTARKALFGAAETERLPAAAYSKAANLRVYQWLRDQAGAALGAGHAVILDAVHLNETERDAAAAVAAGAGVPFTGLWLEAGANALRARVLARRGDASDATPAVVDGQLARDPGPIAWHRIDASGGLDATVAGARAVLPA